VANLTRADGEEFLAIAPKMPARTEAEVFPLTQANEALQRLRRSRRSRILSPLGFQQRPRPSLQRGSVGVFSALVLSGGPAEGEVTYHEGFEAA